MFRDETYIDKQCPSAETQGTAILQQILKSSAGVRQRMRRDHCIKIAKLLSATCIPFKIISYVEPDIMVEVLKNTKYSIDYI